MVNASGQSTLVGASALSAAAGNRVRRRPTGRLQPPC
jgi:hypothetical protein